MITFKQFLLNSVQKNVWSHLTSNDKSDYSDNLLDIVSTAYKHTTLGSFVKSLTDIKNSEWVALDYDHKDDIDTVIFYRLPRQSEKWKGHKIQGIGHDGEKDSKDKLLTKLTKLLNSGGWWIESSDMLSKSLIKRGAYLEKDPEKIKKIFPDVIKFNDDGSYVRDIDGKKLTEYIFGDIK